MPTTRSKAGCSALKVATLEPTARALTHAQYETRAIPGQVPAQYGEPAATYTQPNTQEVPR